MIEQLEVNAVTYMAHLTADGRRWARDISPRAPQYIGLREVWAWVYEDLDLSGFILSFFSFVQSVRKVEVEMGYAEDEYENSLLRTAERERVAYSTDVDFERFLWEQVG